MEMKIGQIVSRQRVLVYNEECRAWMKSNSRGAVIPSRFIVLLSLIIDSVLFYAVSRKLESTNASANARRSLHSIMII